MGRIIMHDFRCDFIFRAATQDNFINPHTRIIMIATIYVEGHLTRLRL
jgi:hypothetical protein